ncbi:MAG: N-acetyltransferase [Anaerolineae bacterium]|jgi:GNAT superfamily N-acetyltransferase|nr:N-acetyltransferase [Anaerolineae bacterium]
MEVTIATLADFEPWLALAQEVEPLFGPMVAEPSFHQALKDALQTGSAFCIREEAAPPGAPLCGGIVIAPEANEIAWFAVAERYQGCGFGKALLAHALSQLNPNRDITVQTFDATSEAGRPARHLYQRFGFTDHQPGQPTPTNIPTVFMVREKNTP